MDISSYTSLFSKNLASLGITGSFSPTRLLVPVTDTDATFHTTTHLHVKIAAYIAQATGAEFFLLSVDSTDPLSMEPTAVRERFISDDELESASISDQFPDVYGRDGSKRIATAVAHHDIDALCLPSQSSMSSVRRITRTPAERIAATVDCDTIVLNGKWMTGPVSSILLPVAGGPHSGMALALAEYLAEETGAWIDLLHVTESESDADTRRAEAFLEDAAALLTTTDRYDTWVIDSLDVPATIIDQSSYYDLTILGAPTSGLLKQFIFGSTTNEIRTEIDNAVLMVKSNA